ncbi:MAG: hypothetical protein JXA54_12980 [Candidatus Heimdallarchaeota archaeon]|nr:hypothetical protein [Candidatus Heimdallarchaeota archaeon]
MKGINKVKYIVLIFFLMHLSTSIFLLNFGKINAYVVIDDPPGGSYNTVGWEYDGTYYHTAEKYKDYSATASPYDNLVWFSKVIGEGIEGTNGYWDEDLIFHLIVQAGLNNDRPDYYYKTLFYQKYWSYYIDEITIKMKVVFDEGGINKLLEPYKLPYHENKMYQTDATGVEEDDFMETAVDGMVWLFNKVKDGFGTAVQTILDYTADGNWPAGWTNGVSGDYYQWKLNHGWGAGREICGVHVCIDPWWLDAIGTYHVYMNVELTGKIIGMETSLFTSTRIDGEGVFSSTILYDFYVTCTDY